MPSVAEISLNGYLVVINQIQAKTITFPVKLSKKKFFGINSKQQFLSDYAYHSRLAKLAYVAIWSQKYEMKACGCSTKVQVDARGLQVKVIFGYPVADCSRFKISEIAQAKSL